MSDPSVMNDSQAKENLSTDSTAQEKEKPVSTRPWIAHYEQGVPAQIDTPDQPLTWILDQTVSRYPNHTALIYFGTKLSYAQLSAQANRFAAELQRLGVKKGDRVAIALPNIPQYPIAFYGALRAGAVVVPTNPLYTEREMQHQLNDSGARVIVMLDIYYPVVRAVRADTALEKIIITSPADFMPPVLRTLYPLSLERDKLPKPPMTARELRDEPMLLSMSRLLQAHTTGSAGDFNRLEQAAGDDLAILQYTGGTTGLSKGAMLTHRNLLSNALQTRAWVHQIRDGEESTLCVAPFFHSYGLTVGMNLSIVAAATMVLLPRFKSKEVLSAIRRYRPTLFPGIPTMYIAIMRQAGKHIDQLRSIKYCISGAAPLPAKVHKDFESMTGGKLVEGYGLSEASPVTHCNPLNGDIRDGSIGLPFPNVDSAIVDQESGAPLPVDEVGEIVVNGPNIMQGYWNRKEETEAIFVNEALAEQINAAKGGAISEENKKGRWMHTGDLGKMDANGYFYVLERAKDMILASGFNVYPREVEEVLFHHPAVQEAAVVGVPHEYRGETVATFIVLKAGFTPSEDTRQDIIAFCKKELVAYKVPKIVEFRESLPKSLIGKVLRRELRQIIIDRK